MRGPGRPVAWYVPLRVKAELAGLSRAQDGYTSQPQPHLAQIGLGYIIALSRIISGIQQVMFSSSSINARLPSFQCEIRALRKRKVRTGRGC